MSYLLTTPSSVEPLSLTEAKAHLRFTSSDDDPYISTLIIAARRLVELRCGLCLLQQSWSIFHDQWPGDGIFKLQIHPVLSVADVVIYGEDDTAATVDPSHYYVDSVSRPARLVLRRGRVFPSPGRSANGIEVKLVAGFGAAADAVPQPIKQAMLIAVADWYANRGDVAASQLPLTAVELLAPYRSLRLA